MQNDAEKLYVVKATIRNLKTRVMVLKDELQASEDGSGITDIKEQLEAQFNACKTCYNCGYTS